MSLITKHRPDSLKGIMGHQSVVKALADVIAKRSSQTFLFIGPSGVGKTTMARIAATMLGCTPTDIREVDGATYTGIDAMRELTSSLQYRPLGKSQVKGIIVNEVQALSKSAWEALLMALEEPPPWVYWFLTTTDANKVPLTVKTRGARFELKDVSKNDILDLLLDVADKEQLKTPDEVLELCAKEANGSPRQALSNLAVCGSATTRKEAAELLQTADQAPEAIDLARELCGGQDWQKCWDLMLRMKDMDPESIRHVVQAYVSTVCLKANTSKQAIAGLTILEQFTKPFPSRGGMGPVIVAVGRIIFS